MNVNNTNIKLGTIVTIKNVIGEDAYLNGLKGKVTHPFAFGETKEGWVGVFLDNGNKCNVKVTEIVLSEKELTKSQSLKQMIIENYIDWLTSDEAERKQMKDEAFDYIKEDWVNEITQGLNVSEDTLGIHTTCQNCGSSTNL